MGEPDPLLPFLVPPPDAPPPPPPPPAITSHHAVPHPIPTLDPDPPHPNPQDRGSHPEEKSDEHHLQADTGDGEPQDPDPKETQPAAPPLRSTPATHDQEDSQGEKAQKKASASMAAEESDPQSNGQEQRAQRSAPAYVSSAQVPIQLERLDHPSPDSPTVIAAEIQEKGWELFPQLAKDLKRLKELQTSIQEGDQANQESRISIGSKGENTTVSKGIHINKGAVNSGSSVHSRNQAAQTEKEIQTQEGHNAEAKGKLSPTSTEEAFSSKDNNHIDEGWEPARKPATNRANSEVHRGGGDMQPFTATATKTRSPGFEVFKTKMEGKCYNCFSTEHIARQCHSPHRCWKCFEFGHRAIKCSLQRPEPVHKTTKPQAPESQTKLKPPTSNSSTTKTPLRDGRSYAEVTKGEAAMAARYPGDPRARPATAYCVMTATGAIKRRRDDLVDRAAVCWLDGNSHDTEPYHLSDVFLSKMDMSHGKFQIVKHYPEQFLVVFSDNQARQRVLDRGSLTSRGRTFHFGPWSERLHATNTTWDYRVKVRIEGIPIHCWGEELAAMALGRSCAIHLVEEKTRRRERTRTYDVWAWCFNPCDIPKEVIFTLTEPDKEQPPTNIPLSMLPNHRDPPVDIKRGHIFTLRNHLEVVEDLSFLQGCPRIGGARNRQPRRELIWAYGQPDSVGERPPADRSLDRGRDINYHRRDDDDYDHARRNQGTRRYRSVSSWARNPRCKSGVGDCISTTRWRGGRSRVAETKHKHQVWRVKGSSEKNKLRKTVTWAEPLTTVLMPKKANQPDDSLQFIKAPADGAAIKEKAREVITMEMIQQALAITLKNMEKTLQTDNGHFARPVEQKKMDAIQTIIEEGAKKMKKSGKKEMKNSGVGVGAA